MPDAHATCRICDKSSPIGVPLSAFAIPSFGDELPLSLRFTFHFVRELYSLLTVAACGNFREVVANALSRKPILKRSPGHKHHQRKSRPFGEKNMRPLLCLIFFSLFGSLCRNSGIYFCHPKSRRNVCSSEYNIGVIFNVLNPCKFLTLSSTMYMCSKRSLKPSMHIL